MKNCLLKTGKFKVCYENKSKSSFGLEIHPRAKINKMLTVAILAALVFLMLPNLKADEIHVGKGDGTTDRIPFDYLYNGGWSISLFTQNDFSEAGIEEGVINSVAIKVKTSSTRTNWGTVTVWLANTDLTAIPAGSPPNLNVDYTQIYQSNAALSTNVAGSEIIFASPEGFEYTGGGLLVYICYGGPWGGQNINFYMTNTPVRQTFMNYSDNISTVAQCGIMTGTFVQQGNYRVDATFDIDMGANELKNTFPTADTLFYCGVPLANDQKPQITFYKEKETGANAKFTYTITRKANPDDPEDADEVVYVGKNSDLPTADTFITTQGCCQPEISALVNNATGSMAGANGLFKMIDPLPKPGEYEVAVRWYSGSAAHGSKPKQEIKTTFTIQDALAQYRGVVPNSQIPIVIGVPLSPEQYPSIKSYRVVDESKAPIITFTVTDPNGSIVYQALDEETGLPEITLDNDTIGRESIYYFRRASGSLAMPNNGASAGLLNTSALVRGVYNITVTFNDGILPTHTFTDQFTATLEYDLQLSDVINPRTKSSATDLTNVVVPLGAKFPIEYNMANMGVHTCFAYDFVAEIYAKGGNTPLQTIRHNFNSTLTPIPQTSYRQMATEAIVDVDSLNGVGDYIIKCKITSRNPSTDDDTTNNVWPLATETFERYFTVGDPYKIVVTEMTAPPEAGGNDEVYRYPYRPTFTVENTGVTDINGCDVTIEIRYGNDIVYSEKTKLADMTANGTSELMFNKIFIPQEIGGPYEVTLTFDLYSGTPYIYETEFDVNGGLNSDVDGPYTIGATGSGNRNFETFQEAIDALYYRGVAGNVVFELIDRNYTFEENSETNPPLDLRSKIVGAGPNATITFRPSQQMMTEQEPIELRVFNSKGIGILFGQSIAPYSKVAIVNQVTDIEHKRFYANSNGYIIFDGGSQKNLQVILTEEFTENGVAFSAPFYLGVGANNITIKNCRIIGRTVSAKKAIDIPNIFYTGGGNAEFIFDNDMLTVAENGETKAYSAGVVIRNKPIMDLRINNIEYFVDNVKADNNTIEGNIIKNFGYGIVSLGMGAKLDNINNVLIPMYNENNKFNSNYIDSVAKAGIFLGFEENTVITNNRISNVLSSVDGSVATAGILSGLEFENARPNDLHYNNIGAIIERNEIDRVYSSTFAAGINVVQPSFELGFMNRTYLFPNDSSSYSLTNNIIYGINSTVFENCASRYGIAITPTKEAFDAAKYKINKVLIANNTVRMEDAEISNFTPIETEEAVAGILIFDVNKCEVFNNAIYMKIDTATVYNYIAPIAIRSQNPKKLNGNIQMNNNAYFIDTVTYSIGKRQNPNVGLVRFFELDEYGRLLDNGGTAQEYLELAQWINWTEMDKNSMVYNFAKDMSNTTIKFSPTISYTVTRMNSYDNLTFGMPLNNRGKIVNYVTTDIDGTKRVTTGKNFDIGAIEFETKTFLNDFEVRYVSAPAAYRNAASKFGDAEYFMLPKNTTVEVKAIVRNSGQIYLTDIPVICTVTGPFGGASTVTDRVNVTLAVGEEKEISFFTSENNLFRPVPYSQLPETAIPALNQPKPEFAQMLTTVTPIYQIDVKLDESLYAANDEYKANNSATKNTRFYVPQSNLNLVISAENSYANLYDEQNAAVETDQDIVAGRLNFDTVVAALNKIGYRQEVGEGGSYDFDVFERKGWEPRSVNYSIYKGVIWSDGHDSSTVGQPKKLTYWEKQNLIDFANAGTPARKTTLIASSQEMLRLNNPADDRFNSEIQNAILGAEQSKDYSAATTIQIKGKEQNSRFVIDVAKTNYTVGAVGEVATFEDAEPKPSSFKIFDTLYGQSLIAYYFYDANAENPDSSIQNRISSITGKNLTRNTIYTAIDWRHLKNAAAFMGGIFNDIGKELIEDPKIVLPLELLSFDAINVNKKVHLNWKTATEQNLANFEIERANVNDANTNNVTYGIFNSIETKQARGYSSEILDYDATDENVQYAKKYAYRLKINDFDGNYKYSPIKIVNIEYSEGISIGEAYPNPAKESANVKYSLNEISNVKISLNDLSGREIATLFEGEKGIGTHDVNVKTNNLAAGSYSVVFVINGKLISKTVMINVAK